MFPVLGGIMLAALMLALSMFPVKEASLISGSKWWGHYWRHSHSSYDGPLWTMHTELLGSLLVFGVLLVSPARWVRVLCYAFLAALTAGGYLLAFVGGMAICEAWVAWGDVPRRWAWLFVPVGVYGLVLGSYPLPSSSTPDFYSQIVPGLFGSSARQQALEAHVLGALLVLVAVIALHPVRRPLESRPVHFLGRVSFSLYILHFLVLGSLGAALLIALDDVLPYTANALVVFAVVVVASIGVSWVYTRLVDEPATALTGRAYKRARANVERWRAEAARGAAPAAEVPRCPLLLVTGFFFAC
jgi:peptidoglycan/LPS O-acetylase OafA/YrhL